MAERPGPRGTVVLGLDPGSRYTGYGVVEKRGSRLELRAQGRIAVPSATPLPERLARLAAGLKEVLERHSPEAAGVETPFHGANSRSLIVLAQARGALLATLGARGCGVFEYSPSQVKAAVTGSGRAPKAQVERMVRTLLGCPSAELTSDAADALAVAVCCAQRLRREALEALLKGSRK